MRPTRGLRVPRARRPPQEPARKHCGRRLRLRTATLVGILPVGISERSRWGHGRGHGRWRQRPQPPGRRLVHRTRTTPRDGRRPDRALVRTRSHGTRWCRAAGPERWIRRPGNSPGRRSSRAPAGRRGRRAPARRRGHRDAMDSRPGPDRSGALRSGNRAPRTPFPSSRHDVVGNASAHRRVARALLGATSLVPDQSSAADTVVVVARPAVGAASETSLGST